MAKNIVIFSDGTGQEGGRGNNTNIYNLYNMIEDRTDKQVSFYDPGLGTGWRKISGSAGGAGISRNIKECYTFISDNFEAGDEIYLFGFSRGAATVRSLASMIHEFGILPKSRYDLIGYAYDTYSIRDKEKRESETKAFVKRHHTMWTRIKFLGCFDTVAALGIPYEPVDVILDKLPFLKHKFHNFKLSEAVENAYQALAIDDRRETFHPILWDETGLKDYQTIQQVWFCGMHTDVGGGYKSFDLSDIPLLWMKNKAEEHGLRIHLGHKVLIQFNIDGEMHNSREGTFAKFYPEKERFWDSTRTDKPIVHQSVLERTKNVNNEDEPPYDPWILQLDYEVELYGGDNDELFVLPLDGEDIILEEISY
jgi:uncharacterized protein (DUF2235 family)